MTLKNRLALVLGSLSLIGLVGCGAPGNTTQPLGSSSVSKSEVYAVGGQYQLIVKRRIGGTPLAIKNLKKLRATKIAGIELDAVSDGNVEAALAALKNDPTVEYAEPNFRMTSPDSLKDLMKRAVTPNPESNFKGAYGPKLINAIEAHGKTTGEGQIIAVVDTGVDDEHPDFKGRMVGGINTADPGNGSQDDQGHGTNVAGIAAAKKNDKMGTIGVAPGAKIMSVKVLGADGSGSDMSVAEGIRWAADNGATVINLSLGGSYPSQTGAEAVKYALGKGCVVVAAMGNNGSGASSYPAAYPGVVAVGATDCNDKIASFSQYGKHISVTAPGYSILSTYPTYHVSSLDDYAKNKAFMEKFGMRMEKNYAYVTGTSQATPHVAGLAALIRAMNPKMTPAEVKAKLEGGTVRTPAMTSNFDDHFGFGRINAVKSL